MKEYLAAMDAVAIVRDARERFRTEAYGAECFDSNVYHDPAHIFLSRVEEHLLYNANIALRGK